MFWCGWLSILLPIILKVSRAEHDQLEGTCNFQIAQYAGKNLMTKFFRSFDDDVFVAADQGIFIPQSLITIITYYQPTEDCWILADYPYALIEPIYREYNIRFRTAILVRTTIDESNIMKQEYICELVVFGVVNKMKVTAWFKSVSGFCGYRIFMQQWMDTRCENAALNVNWLPIRPPRIWDDDPTSSVSWPSGGEDFTSFNTSYWWNGTSSNSSWPNGTSCSSSSSSSCCHNGTHPNGTSCSSSSSHSHHNETSSSSHCHPNGTCTSSSSHCHPNGTCTSSSHSHHNGTSCSSSSSSSCSSSSSSSSCSSSSSSHHCPWGNLPWPYGRCSYPSSVCGSSGSRCRQRYRNPDQVRIPWPRVPQLPRYRSSSESELSDRIIRLRNAMYGPRRDRRRWWKLDEAELAGELQDMDLDLLEETDCCEDIDPWSRISLHIEHDLKLQKQPQEPRIIIPSKVQQPQEDADDESFSDSDYSDDEQAKANVNRISKMLVQFDPEGSQEIFEFSSETGNSFLDEI